MTDDRDNPLLDLVDALTKPEIEHHVQTDDDGKYIKTHTAEHLPLLAQLKAAINPSSNTAAGSASLKSNRNLIDSTAMFEYGKMTAAIGDWCRIWKVPRAREPISDPNARIMSDLRHWYIAYVRGGDDPQWYVKELGRWVSLIRNMIEPSTDRIPLRFPCPVCKSATFVTDEGEVSTFPLLMEYRKPRDGESIKPKITCRNIDCGASWDDYDAIVELGEEMAENKDSEKSLEKRTTTV